MFVTQKMVTSTTCRISGQTEEEQERTDVDSRRVSKRKTFFLKTGTGLNVIGINTYTINEALNKYTGGGE